MSPLRQRFIQDLQLSSKAERTVAAYVRAVVRLSRHYDDTRPDRITEDQVRDYLVQLTTVEKISRSTPKIALCALRCFYRITLGPEWNVFDIARPPHQKKLPVVLNRSEVARTLAALRIPSPTTSKKLLECSVTKIQNVSGIHSKELLEALPLRVSLS